MMKLYVINIKEYDYDCYTDFVVVANTIPEALEYIYQKVCEKSDTQGNKYYGDIPYYLRSSNMIIACLGDFEPCDKLDNHVISYGYYNA